MYEQGPPHRMTHAFEAVAVLLPLPPPASTSVATTAGRPGMPTDLSLARPDQVDQHLDVGDAVAKRPRLLAPMPRSANLASCSATRWACLPAPCLPARAGKGGLGLGQGWG